MTAPYDINLFNKLRDISQLARNRRNRDRRLGPRRYSNSATPNNRRASTDRRLNDRRLIVNEALVDAPLKIVAAKLRDLHNLSSAFENFKITRKTHVTSSKTVTDWQVRLDDGGLFFQFEVDYGPSERFISFRQVKGDFQQLFGYIEMSPSQNHTRIKLSVMVEPGLPSFETILGEVFRSKIRGLTRQYFDRLIDALGGKVASSNHFGFMIHTIPDYFANAFFDNTYAKMPDVLFRFLLRQLPPFKAASVNGVRSANGKALTGDLIFSPFSPAHFLTLDKGALLDHMLMAGKIAVDLGAKILGLGAYTAFVGKRGVEIAEKLNLPVTTGTAYTIATAIRALEEAAFRCGLPLADSSVAIVGATGSIGRTCAELLANRVKKLTLVARNASRLNDLVVSLTPMSTSELSATSNLEKALKESQLVLISTNSPETLVEMKYVQPGTIICDISQPRNVAYDDAARRPDVLIIDGGVVQPPGQPNFNIYFGLPAGLTYACLGETMILALEERFESYSIGGNISARRVREIELLGEKHGFKLADLKSFGKLISSERFRGIETAMVSRIT
jgi:fatty aldehyde-generating acyl-ACP reductase